MAALSPSSTAVRRLRRDFLEQQTEPITNCWSWPLEHDLFEWHGNLAPKTGQYAGSLFHLVFIFPEDYPSKPPRVKLCTPIPHPNVFGDWICLDMLKNQYTTTKYAGWSSAYSVSSILLQLESFLFADKIPQDFGEYYQKITDSSKVGAAIGQARQFWCSACGHCSAKPAPPPFVTSSESLMTQSDSKHFIGFKMEKRAETKPDTNTKKKLGRKNYWACLYDALVSLVFTFLSDRELQLAVRSTRQFRTVARKFHILEQREMRCFYRKCSYKDDVLGFGLWIEKGPGDRVQDLKVRTDTLSYGAFAEDQVRHSVWKEPFSQFLPLYINEGHSQKAFPLMERLIADVMRGLSGARSGPGTGTGFEPALAFFNKLLNKTVVQFMRDVSADLNFEEKDLGVGAAAAAAGMFGRREQNRQPQQQLHHSEAALETFCAAHHWLCGFAVRHPQLLQQASWIVKQFIASPVGRTKKAVPDLGEFLVLLPLSGVSWKAVSDSFLNELYTRDVRWILQKHPELEHKDMYPDRSSCYRLRTTFQASITGKRLLMFQVYFVQALSEMNGDCGSSSDPQVFAPASGAAAAASSSVDAEPWFVRRCLNKYNRALGRPSREMVSNLQNAIKAILKVDDWLDFFKRLSLPAPRFSDLTVTLRQAIVSSVRNGYHRPEFSRAGRCAQRGPMAVQACLCEAAGFSACLRAGLCCVYGQSDMKMKLALAPPASSLLVLPVVLSASSSSYSSTSSSTSSSSPSLLLTPRQLMHQPPGSSAQTSDSRQRAAAGQPPQVKSTVGAAAATSTTDSVIPLAARATPNSNSTRPFSPSRSPSRSRSRLTQRRRRFCSRSCRSRSRSLHYRCGRHSRSRSRHRHRGHYLYRHHRHRRSRSRGRSHSRSRRSASRSRDQGRSCSQKRSQSRY